MKEFQDFLVFDRPGLVTYLSKLTWVEKVYYLEWLESSYKDHIPIEYYDVYRPFDRQLLLEQPTEASTRIFELHTYLT